MPLPGERAPLLHALKPRHDSLQLRLMTVYTSIKTFYSVDCNTCKQKRQTRVANFFACQLIVYAREKGYHGIAPPRDCPSGIAPTGLPQTELPQHGIAPLELPQRNCPNGIAPTRNCPDTELPRHGIAPTRNCPDTELPRHGIAPAQNCPGMAKYMQFKVTLHFSFFNTNVNCLICKLLCG